jgi:hypothetical protein
MKLPIKYYSVKYFIIFALIVFFLIGFIRHALSYDVFPPSVPSSGQCPVTWFPDGAWVSNVCYSVCTSVPGYAYCSSVLDGEAYPVCLSNPGSPGCPVYPVPEGGVVDCASYPAIGTRDGFIWTLLDTHYDILTDPINGVYCRSMAVYGREWRDSCQSIECPLHEHFDAVNCRCVSDCPTPPVCYHDRVWSWETCSCYCEDDLEGRCCPSGSSPIGSWCGCRDDQDPNIVVLSVPIFTCPENYYWNNENCNCEFTKTFFRADGQVRRGVIKEGKRCLGKGGYEERD